MHMWRQLGWVAQGEAPALEKRGCRAANSTQRHRRRLQPPEDVQVAWRSTVGPTRV